MRGKPPGKAWKVTVHGFRASKTCLNCLICFVVDMSWKKSSADAGLAGLKPEEAAKGALFWEEFQNMPDPLDDPRSVLRVSLNL